MLSVSNPTERFTGGLSERLSSERIDPRARVSPRHRCQTCGGASGCLHWTSNRAFSLCTRVEYWNGVRGRFTANGVMPGWLYPLDGAYREPVRLPPKRRGKSSEQLEPLTRAQTHAIFMDLASMCGLREAALVEAYERRDFLEGLGQTIVFSLPKAGIENARISEQLAEKYGVSVLRRFPGIRMDKGRPRLPSVKAGREDFVLVCKDADGFAHCGIIRRLPWTKQSSYPKYQLMSSGRADEASLTGRPQYHLAGAEYEGPVLCITEGWHKAELASRRLRMPVIGLLSVSPNEETIEAIRRAMLERAAEDVILAFDADKHETHSSPWHDQENCKAKPTCPRDASLVKPGIKRGEQRLLDVLSTDFDPYSYEWQYEAGKGLDDLLVAGGTPRLVSRYTKPVPKPRVPQACPEPGPVDDGPEIGVIAHETENVVRRGKALSSKGYLTIAATPAGGGKSGANAKDMRESNVRTFVGVASHLQAEETKRRIEEGDCAHNLPANLCPECQTKVTHQHGRDEHNCANLDVVQEAQRTGYGEGIGRNICGTEGDPRCLFRPVCGYYQQKKQPGHKVGPSEVIIFDPTSTENTAAVVFDDPDTLRTFIRQVRVTEGMLERGMQAPAGKALRPFIELIQRAMAKASAAGFWHGDAWYALEEAALEMGISLSALIDSIPDEGELAPHPSIEGYRAAPPGQVVQLLKGVREELDWWLTRQAFTSGLRIRNREVEFNGFRLPTQGKDGKTALDDKSVVFMSATVTPVEREYFAQIPGIEVLPEYAPKAKLPANVRVIQDASAFYGHGATSNDTTRLLSRAKAYLEELHPDRPAVVTHKHLIPLVVSELGIPEDRCLWYGNQRGSNNVRDADVLLVIGTPGMSTEDAYRLAVAAHRGPGRPLSPHLVMRKQRYGGFRDEHGRGREIEVQVFRDHRVNEVYESSRRDEMVQGIFRARPYDVLDGWETTLDDFDEGAAIGREALARRKLTVVLLSAYPVPGLRVDELRYGGNAARSEDARRRLDQAAATLEATGATVTSRNLAAQAGSRVETAQEWLRTSAVRSPTPIRDLFIQVGDQTVETAETPLVEAPTRFAQALEMWQELGRPSPPKTLPRTRSAHIDWVEDQYRQQVGMSSGP